MLRIRIRSHAGVSTLNVSGDSPLAGLRAELEQTLNIPAEQQKLLYGFPPTEIVQDDFAPLSAIIKTGDTITVEKKGTSGQSVAAEPVQFRQKPSQQPPAHIDVSGEFLVRKIPDDNSCLFNAVGYVLESKTRTAGARIRRQVADAIRADPETYNDAVLGKSRQEYLDWISKPSSWGGAIEVAALSKMYQAEIGVVDATTGLHQIFGQGEHYNRRVWLLYDGIHYDAIAQCPSKSDESKDKTVFTPDDQHAFKEALAIGTRIHKQGKYTNTATFTVKCNICKQILTGETGVSKHAQATGHTDFFQALMDLAPKGNMSRVLD